jgi:hypothetical protein
MFLKIFIPMFLCMLTPILVYSIRKCRKDWDVISFFIYNRFRIGLSVVVTLLLSYLMAYNPESVEPILTMMHLPASLGAAGIGLALGGQLISVMPSADKYKDDYKVEGKYDETNRVKLNQ